MSFSTPAEIETAHQTLVKTFKTGKTKSLAWRKWQLKQIWWLMEDNEKAIIDALSADLNRHELETQFADINGVKSDVLLHLSKLERWAADEIPEDAGFLFGTICHARIRREPLGVAFVIGAWNFPLALMLQPLLAATSAGCCCLLKPSEIAVATAKLITELVPKYLDSEAIQVVNGGPKETGLMLEKRFDSIFYTGSPAIGKVISAAAAKHLTPTVLELGGQCPVIVTKTADINLAAKRIALNKYFNAGQICLSPNHVFVDPGIHDAFVDRAQYWFTQFSSKESKSSLVHIVSDKHHERILTILANTNGTFKTGDRPTKTIANATGKGGSDGGVDKSTRLIPPTLITDVKLQDSTMSEEIFGPVLPVLKADIPTAISIISGSNLDPNSSSPSITLSTASSSSASGELPLGLYIFSTSPAEINHILAHTNSGGVTINDCMFHPAVPTAPFGGVGNSGHGAYHGRYGFEAFSHRRTVVQVPGWFEYLIGFRYPPYTAAKLAKIPKAKNPGFRRGERMTDQKVGGDNGIRKWLLGTTVGVQIGKLVLFAVLLAIVDAGFGGESRLIGVLRDVGNGVKAKSPF